MFENSDGSHGNPLRRLELTKMFAMEFCTINHASEGDARWAKTPFRAQTGLFKQKVPPTHDGRQLHNPRSPVPLSAFRFPLSAFLSLDPRQPCRQVAAATARAVQWASYGAVCSLAGSRPSPSASKRVILRGVGTNRATRWPGRSTTLWRHFISEAPEWGHSYGGARGCY